MISVHQFPAIIWFWPANRTVWLGCGEILMKKQSTRQSSCKRSGSSKQHGAILTPRQVQILRLIHLCRVSNGCSPTLQELAAKLRLSKVTVFEHVEALVRKGLVHRSPNRARSLTIDPSVAQTGAILSCGGDDIAEVGEDLGLGDPGCYPLVGCIAAGVPLEAIENPDVLDLTGMFDSCAGTFALVVRGDSMIDEQIRDGDYVLVEKSDSARDGQIVVAMLENGEATLKKYYRHNKGFRLEAANPDFPPIYVNQINIQGIVIGVIRRY